MKLFVIFSYRARACIFFKISCVVIGTNHFCGLQGPSYLNRFDCTPLDEVGDLYGLLCDKNTKFSVFLEKKIPIFAISTIGELNLLVFCSIYSVLTICV